MPVLDARNAALEEELVRDPDDLMSYAVYGDWLAEQGDPRGELIATQLAAEQGDPAMRRAAARVYSRHREYFLGSLADTIAGGAFEWRAGFIQRARLAYELLLFVDGARVATSVEQLVEQLLAHPSARFLVDLTLGTIGRDRWGRALGHHQAAIAKLVAARPRTLRRLHLGDVGSNANASLGPLEAVWPAVPGLHELVLEGDFELGASELPELRRVELRPATLR
nr:TIGR02996 domain-containing protein [Myxococcota bacterium]